MPPRYRRMADKVLPDWDISLVFMSAPQARALNKRLRNKSYVPNVLSYKVGPHSGEIIICREVARKQAPAYGMSETKFTFYLFIHGLLHLEGRRHGSTMERREQALLEEFGARSHSIHGSTHRNRHRHRDLSGQGGRRRGSPR